MPPAGYPAFLQYLQSGRVRKVSSFQLSSIPELSSREIRSIHQFLIVSRRRDDLRGSRRAGVRAGIVADCPETNDMVLDVSS